MLKLRTLFAAVFIIALSVVAPAFAQEADTVVNLGSLLAPWMEILIGAVMALVVALLGWLTVMIKEKTGVDLESFRQQTLQVALDNAAGLIKARALAAADKIDFDVRHPAIKEAILYVNNAAPDAVAHWGLTSEEIAQKILAKLGVQSGTTPPPPTVVNTVNE